MNIKNVLSLILASAMLAFAGCKTDNSLLTPAALERDVSQGLRIGLDIDPAIAPDVALARDVICLESGKTNQNPQAIANDLQALHITNNTAKAAIDGGLLVYENIYALLNTNSTAKVQPYLESLCTGFSSALPSANMAARRGHEALPPHIK